ncbi:MAG: hypothetical protein OHK0015_30740 [Chloroflexi bacterium OHK40]
MELSSPAGTTGPVDPASQAEQLFRQGCACYNVDRARAALYFAQALEQNPRHQRAMIMLANCDGAPRETLLQRAFAVDAASLDGQLAAQLLNGPGEPSSSAGGRQWSALTPTVPESEQAGASSAPRRLQPGDLIGGKYEILAYHSTGGFGSIYLARDRELNRLCVVKQLRARPGMEAALHNEVRMLVALNSPGHEGIPEIYGLLADEHCLVMKYVEGHSLFKQFQHRPPPERVALKLLREAASALAYMHGHTETNGRIVPKLHRDVTPNNLMLDTRKRLWLVDFGLASAEPPAESRAGSPRFIAPEQAAGKPQPGSDVYGLAASFAYILSAGGKHTRLPPRLSRLLDGMMAPQPDQRPPAAWVVDALDTMLALRLARTTALGMLVTLAVTIVSTALLLLTGIVDVELPSERAREANLQRQLTTTRSDLDTARSQLTTTRSDLEATRREIERLRNLPFPAQAIPLISGAGSVRGTLDPQRMTEFWTFVGQAGDSATLHATGGGTGMDDPVLLLFSPDGQILAYNDDVPEESTAAIQDSLDALIQTALPADGLYTVQVTSYKYTGYAYPALGSYTLSVHVGR